MNIYVHQFDGVTTMRVLPLAAGTIVAAAKRDRDLAERCRFTITVRRDAPDDVVAAYQAPDVIAFSCYTWNARYTLAVAALAKARYPHARVVLGGPSVPRASDALHAFFARHATVDAVVIGEGEVTFRQLLVAWRDAEPLERVAGLAWRDAAGCCVINAPRPRLSDFSDTASPYLDGTFDALLDAQRERLDAAVIETNRGCPFACTFCDWGQAIASRVHELPLARVTAELDAIAAAGLPYLYIVDANFGIRPRDLSIVQHVAALKQRVGAPAYCYFHLTKNATQKNLATVETLRAAGVGCQVALSMQDFDPRVLNAVQRKNIKLSRSLELRRTCNERGIPTFNELLLGLPEQTCDGLRASVVKALTPYPGDSFFLYPVRLLENAAMASPEHRARYGLQTRHCRVAAPDGGQAPAWVEETEEVVVATNALPLADWRRAYAFGYLVSLAHNLGALTIVEQYLREVLTLPLGPWLEALADAVDAAPPDTVFGRLRAELARYTTSILDGGPLTLPAADPAAGPRHREPAEALLVCALADWDAFIDAAEAVTRSVIAASPTADHDALDDLFHYQRLSVPTPDRRRRSARFRYDWRAFRANAGRQVPLAKTPTALVYEPPPYAFGGLAAFVGAHLAATYAKAVPEVLVEVR